MKGGAKKPELAKLLCVNSAADVDWLVEKFNLDLSLVARLGGHSQPRTHRGKERFPGIQMLEKVAEKTDLARIVTKAKVFKLVTEGNACVGCVYEKGGFGADFTSNSLLAQYRPDLLHLPTTNGEHCTGDGIKMGEAIGAKSIDLEWVQVHPTGLVKPDDADAKIKFLAAEALQRRSLTVIPPGNQLVSGSCCWGRRQVQLVVLIFSSRNGTLTCCIRNRTGCIRNRTGLSCAMLCQYFVMRDSARNL
eukprot:s394_g5.t1